MESCCRDSGRLLRSVRSGASHDYGAATAQEPGAISPSLARILRAIQCSMLLTVSSGAGPRGVHARRLRRGACGRPTARRFRQARQGRRLDASPLVRRRIVK